MLHVPKHEIEAQALELLPSVQDIAMEAGNIVMSWRNSGYETYLKPDDSIVTDADKASSNFIVTKLMELTPNFLVMSEENDVDPTADTPYWSIDPLDGTKVFASGGTGFAVNIALIVGGSPVLGVVNCPAHECLYYSASGIPSFKKEKGSDPVEIRTRPLVLGPDQRPKTLFDGAHAHRRSYDTTKDELYSRFQFELARNPDVGRPMQLNLRVAEGHADVHVKTGKVCEKDGTPRPLTERAGYSWDNAADRIIVRNAGGCIVDVAKLFGIEANRNGSSRYRESAYMAFGDANLARRIFPEYAISG